MDSVEKTVEYRFDSKIYSSEDVRKKIEETKKSFSKISNKPIEVRMEMDEFGVYIVVFKFYAKGKYVKPKKDKKISRIHIESLDNKSSVYIYNLIGNKDTKYIKKMQDRSKQTKELQKKLKQNIKKSKKTKIEYVKQEKEKSNKTKNIEIQRLNDYEQNNKREKIDKKKEKEEKIRKPHIEYLQREEDKRTFKEKLGEYLQMLKNIQTPKLERKNKMRIKNYSKKENKNQPQEIKVHYKQRARKKDMPTGEKHYWSDNYIPKEYGKYKQSNKKYKPL